MEKGFSRVRGSGSELRVFLHSLQEIELNFNDKVEEVLLVRSWALGQLLFLGVDC